MPPSLIIVRISVNGSDLATGVAARINGRCVDVSVLNATAERLQFRTDITKGSEAELIFQSHLYGESPRVNGIVRSRQVTQRSTELTIEVEDWARLAEFWESVRRPTLRHAHPPGRRH